MNRHHIITYLLFAGFWIAVTLVMGIVLPH
jgi:hypothetical protein